MVPLHTALKAKKHKIQLVTNYQQKVNHITLELMLGDIYVMPMID